uniref:F-box associated domain-containing protein n=1 Tax=Aegilops tauschii TaxID=37682 RepID=R7VZ93_AEGTA
MEKLDIGSNNIIVFDTTTESFQAMHAPVAPIVPCYNLLFEMDDYESEVWTCKCKIELPVTEIKELWGKHEGCRSAVVVPGNGELLVLVKSAEWLFQIDMDGKLVATFHRKEVVPSRFKLKQTLVPHAFFPTLDGNVVTAMS